MSDAAASSEDDDLDYIPSLRPRRPSQRARSSSRSSRDVPPPVVRTTAHPSGGSGEKIIMTDDDSSSNEVLRNWRRRKAERESNETKKKPASKKRRASPGGAPVPSRSAPGPRPPMPKPKRAKAGPAIVGRRERPARKPAKGSSAWRYSDQEETLSDGAYEKKALPGYLRDKKRGLEEGRKRLEGGDAAEEWFRLPPSWENVEFSDDERMEDLESRPQFETDPCRSYEDIPMEHSVGVIPCSIAQYLRPYQIEGVKFLHKNFVFQEGCVLGDDMGLGKTVQVIAFLTAAFGKTGDERDAKRMRKARQCGETFWYPKVLIICPSSLIHNWQSELETWGWWNIYVYHGKQEDKEAALEAAKHGSLEIMITNYDTYRIRHQEVNMVAWDAVVADECHKIKERSSETTQRMNEINALCRIGLTGTAIQNKYEELWTLLNWCRPGTIGTASEWDQEISRPLKLGQSHDATNRQLAKGRRVAKQLVENLLPPMFLRRMKTLIAHQLPKKTDRVVFCPLTSTQRECYEAYLESDTIRLMRDGKEECQCGSKKKQRECCSKEDAQNRDVRSLIFPAITWLLKLSNHLANWIPDNTDDSRDVIAEKLDLLQTCLPDRWKELVSRERLYNYMDPQMCGKWLVLQKLLHFWHQNGDKVLIFSYSIKLLNILVALFKKTEYNLCYLSGFMTLRERAEAVDTFNHDPDQFVFLISTKAGGVGLNITAANKVVIFDPNWNPSYDLQAQDRAYRIGQTRDVEVFRLVSSGTIEEVVYARQIYKQQQANIGYDASEERRYFSGVMGDDKQHGELFGLKNLFSFQENTMLQEVLNKTNVAEAKAGVAKVVDMGAATEVLDPDLELSDEEGGGEDTAVLKALSQFTPYPPSSQSVKKKKPKNNPITSILASVGVTYTHDNSEVVGTSKVEAQISKRALRQQQQDEGGAGDRRAFEDEVGEFKFRPPMEVKKRQFVAAAKMLGFEDVREFALVVEGWSKTMRERALERFYRGRIEERGKPGRAVIGGGSDGEVEEEVVVVVEGGDGEEQQQLLPAEEKPGEVLADEIHTQIMRQQHQDGNRNGAATKLTDVDGDEDEDEDEDDEL